MNCIPEPAIQSFDTDQRIAFFESCQLTISCMSDRAEQRRRMRRDGRGLGSKLVLFAKGFSKHPHILAIFKVDSEYLRFPFKVRVDYFILYSILVSTFVIFLLLFSMNKRRRTNEASLQKVVSFAKGFSKHPHIFPIFKVVSEYLRFSFKVKVDYFKLY